MIYADTFLCFLGTQIVLESNYFLWREGGYTFGDYMKSILQSTYTNAPIFFFHTYVACSPG